MRRKQTLWGFFAHAGIIVGMMFVVFFAIDRFNPAMEFMTSSLSKWLILVLAVCAVGDGLFSAVLLFQRQKRQEERKQTAYAAGSQTRGDMPRQRQAQAYESTRVPYRRTLPKNEWREREPAPPNSKTW